MERTLRLAKSSDVDAIFLLYKKRVRWMDEKGIQQWNVTSYLDAYPLEYYIRQQSLGNLYVFAENNIIMGAVVLLQEDERWKENAKLPAFYVHNLVTDIRAKNAGRNILSKAEAIARQEGKLFVRLDCAADNAFLNGFYNSLGYEVVGTCQDGAYIGNLREKALF